MSSRTERGRLVPEDSGLLTSRRGRAVPVPFRGFTLIELLVVIGVIAILAAMVVGLGPLANRNKLDRRAKAELAELQLAIDAYKAKKGFYPPSNAQDVSKPPLYYELVGTRKTATGFETLDGAARIDNPSIPTSYGTAITGFINSSSADKNDPDAPAVENFLKKLKPTQVQELSSGARYLGIPFRGLDDPNENFTRWRYNSLNPTHNPEGYDLWIELTQGGKVRTWANFKTKEE